MRPALDVAIRLARPGDAAALAAIEGGMLERLYVDPDLQGRGIGGRPLAEAMCRSPRGLELFAFQRNARARAFHEARDFRAVGCGDGSGNEEREPDVRHTWTGPA
jgi:GNAT superfamily N-acetyltransferase